MRVRMLAVAMVAATTVGAGPFVAGTGAVARARCPAVGPIRDHGEIRVAGVHEISGAAAGVRAHVLWVEQDSGNPARVYAVTTNGVLHANVLVSNATNHDWEDLDLANRTIYVGDIGSNRNAMTLYWFPEPALTRTSVVAKHATLRYPGGQTHNSEAMFVVESNDRLFIVTKERKGGRSFVFGTNLATLGSGDTRVLRSIGAVAMPRVTAADADDSGFIVRSLGGRSLFYPWVGARHGVATAIEAGGCDLRVAPGEAIAFSRWSNQVFTVPEGGSPVIRSIRLKV